MFICFLTLKYNFEVQYLDNRCLLWPFQCMPPLDMSTESVSSLLVPKLFVAVVQVLQC